MKRLVGNFRVAEASGVYNRWRIKIAHIQVGKSRIF